MNSQALKGMMTGTTIMFLFGAIWLFLGLYGGRSSPEWLRMEILATGLVLAVWIGITASRARRVSHKLSPPTSEQSAAGRRIKRRFGWITIIEGSAIFLAVVVFNAAHRPDFISSAIALVVGLHFFPLASLFDRRVYYGTGILGCVIGAVGFLISDPRIRNSFVGLSFGLLLWLTVAAVLAQVLPRSRT